MIVELTSDGFALLRKAKVGGARRRSDWRGEAIWGLSLGLPRFVVAVAIIREDHTLALHAQPLSTCPLMSSKDERMLALMSL